MTFYATVDGPTLVIEGWHVREPMDIVAQPVTYGRVLFRSHDTLITESYFDLPADADYCLQFDGYMRGALVSNSYFRRSEVTA